MPANSNWTRRRPTNQSAAGQFDGVSQTGKAFVTRTPTVLAAIATCLVLNGCALALPAPVVLEGRAFPDTKVSELAAGMGPGDVEALL